MEIIKNGKKPNRQQKELIKANRLVPENWLIFKNVGGYLHLIHRETGTTKKIPAR
ncbi:DUF6906 family protein [Fictibacillus sp. JL2B1089]|uniref:DUF6906 family protein n=1 Tax=Fictibacillus sp. JL2B1089 TaxID=3399565 RepID=UPI003A83B188